MSKKWPQVSKLWELLAQRTSSNSSFFQALHYDVLYVLCTSSASFGQYSRSWQWGWAQSGLRVYPIPIPTVHDRWTFWEGGRGVWGMGVGGVVTTRGCLCILGDSLVVLMARQSKEYVLGFNYILGSILIFLCLKLILVYYLIPKNKGR